MEELVCPYKPCGDNENCTGCSLDPRKREISYEEFRDGHSDWNCCDCRWCNPKADLEGIESKCKRLDHKHYSFAKAIFYSYDCGHRNGCVCSDFEPNEWQGWLYRHYRPKFLVEHGKGISEKTHMSICIDHNWEVRYEIWKKDFFYNCFTDKNGNLRWIRKGYNKINRKSPIGYDYVYEYPDGFIQIGANAQILMEHVPEDRRRPKVGL